MFGGLKKQVDEYYFGYREVRLPNTNEIELPNPYLIRYLTTGNKAKAAEHIKQIFSQRDEVIDLAIKNSKHSIASERLTSQTLNYLEQRLNPAGRSHVETRRDLIAKAISCAAFIAFPDRERMGEQPPVAKGIVIDAVWGLKKLSADEDAMISWAATIALYIIRSSRPN